ncbi:MULTISPECIES: hypothetical protein [Streptomyces]|uniref:hypothetical protein n=1 Tax=Streptomyces TaxID=1883 RepID=UPI002248E362|nr:hypothetical protein [Streptomyces sp. JHD 1]MCX2968007.1 hypothetical protein [Streptomyces sp. JHD 1]
MAAKDRTDGAGHAAGRAVGRHRRERQNLSGTALTGTWLLGNALALFLLGTTATQHIREDARASPPVERSAPDQETTA